MQSKADFIREYSDVLTIEEFVDQLGSTRAYVLRIQRARNVANAAHIAGKARHRARRNIAATVAAEC